MANNIEALTLPAVTKKDEINPQINNIPQDIPRQGLAPSTLPQDIQKDIARREAGLTEAQQELGVKAPSQVERFRERGIKLGGKIVAQNEFNNAMNAQGAAIDKLVTAAGFATQAEKFQATEKINQRLDKIRMDLIKRGLEFDKKLAREGVEDQKRRAAAKMWGSLAGTVAGGVLGGMAFGGSPQGVALGAGVGGQLGSGFGGLL